MPACPLSTSVRVTGAPHLHWNPSCSLEGQLPPRISNPTPPRRHQPPRCATGWATRPQRRCHQLPQHFPVVDSSAATYILPLPKDGNRLLSSLINSSLLISNCHRDWTRERGRARKHRHAVRTTSMFGGVAAGPPLAETRAGRRRQNTYSFSRVSGGRTQFLVFISSLCRFSSPSETTFHCRVCIFFLFLLSFSHTSPSSQVAVGAPRVETLLASVATPPPCRVGTCLRVTSLSSDAVEAV